MMISKSDSDATYCSEAEDMMTSHPLRRSQRLSQKCVNYSCRWYTPKHIKMCRPITPYSRSKGYTKTSPVHNAYTLTQGVFSATDITEDVQGLQDTLNRPQNAVANHQINNTTGDRLRSQLYPDISSTLQTTSIATQVIFSPTDIKEDQESHDILTLKQQNTEPVCRDRTKTLSGQLGSNPYSQISTTDTNTAIPETFLNTDIQEITNSLLTMNPQQKSVPLSQKHRRKSSYKARNKPYSKTCSSYMANILTQDYISPKDIKYSMCSTVNLHQTKVIINDNMADDESESNGVKEQKSNKPVDLSTKKTEDSICKTSAIEIAPTKCDQLISNIDSSSNMKKASQQTALKDTTEGISLTKPKKGRRTRNTSMESTKVATKKRGSAIAKRKRKPKNEFLQHQNNQTKCPILKGKRHETQTIIQTSILPDIYPPHFKYQLPPEAVLTQPLIPIQPNIMTPDDTQSFELKDSTSTSPSLPESLRSVFGTDDLRHLLDIEKLTYHLYDYHVQALAMVLNVREQFLHDLLQKILNINPNSLCKINKAVKSTFVQDRDLFTRTPSAEYGSPSSDVVPNSLSPQGNCRLLKKL